MKQKRLEALHKWMDEHGSKTEHDDFAVRLDTLCGIAFQDGFDAGYQSREDVASALGECRSALRELTNAWGYHQSEYVCEDPRLDEATANAERLLNGGGE